MVSDERFSRLDGGAPKHSSRAADNPSVGPNGPTSRRTGREHEQKEVEVVPLNNTAIPDQARRPNDSKEA
jgi:hypothetical protein